MRRFSMNRWCAFVLTLGVGLFALTSSAGVAQAAQRIDDAGAVGDWMQTGPQTPPPNAGDPDIPDNGLKGGQISGGATPASGTSMRAAGDGASFESVWVWRIQVVLQILRQQHWRF